jgi:hypothetical protein
MLKHGAVCKKLTTFPVRTNSSRTPKLGVATGAAKHTPLHTAASGNSHMDAALTHVIHMSSKTHTDSTASLGIHQYVAASAPCAQMAAAAVAPTTTLLTSACLAASHSAAQHSSKALPTI